MTRYVHDGMEVDAVQWFRHGDHPAVTGSMAIGTCEDCKRFYDHNNHGQIQTPVGVKRVCQGDWVVTYPDGRHEVRSPAVFALWFRPIDPRQEVESWAGINQSPVPRLKESPMTPLTKFIAALIALVAFNVAYLTCMGIAYMHYDMLATYVLIHLGLVLVSDGLYLGLLLTPLHDDWRAKK